MTTDDPQRQKARKKHSPSPATFLNADDVSDVPEGPLFPRFQGKVLEVCILRLEYIGQEASLLLWGLPDATDSWDSSLKMRIDASRAIEEHRGKTDDPHAEMLVRISRHLLESTEHAHECYGKRLEQLRRRWMWLDRAVAEELLRFAPHVGRVHRGAWPYAPAPSVYPWIEAVHDAAVSEAAQLRKHGMRFKQPISLALVSRQLGKRVDVISGLLARNKMFVGGTKRKPVAELEDVVACYPEYAEVLRELVRKRPMPSGNA